jgi:hypothetical protein
MIEEEWRSEEIFEIGGELPSLNLQSLAVGETLL